MYYVLVPNIGAFGVQPEVVRVSDVEQILAGRDEPFRALPTKTTSRALAGGEAHSADSVQPSSTTPALTSAEPIFVASNSDAHSTFKLYCSRLLDIQYSIFNIQCKQHN